MGRDDDAVEGGEDRNADQLAIEGRHQSDGGQASVQRVGPAVPVGDAASSGIVVEEVLQVEVHARSTTKREERQKGLRSTREARVIIGSGKRPELGDVRVDSPTHPRPVALGQLPAGIVIGRGHDATKPAVDGHGIGAGSAIGCEPMVPVLRDHRLVGGDVEGQPNQNGRGKKTG